MEAWPSSWGRPRRSWKDAWQVRDGSGLHGGCSGAGGIEAGDGRQWAAWCGPPFPYSWSQTSSTATSLGVCPSEPVHWSCCGSRGRRLMASVVDGVALVASAAGGGWRALCPGLWVAHPGAHTSCSDSSGCRMVFSFLSTKPPP